MQTNVKTASVQAAAWFTSLSTMKPSMSRCCRRQGSLRPMDLARNRNQRKASEVSKSTKLLLLATSTPLYSKSEASFSESSRSYRGSVMQWLTSPASSA